MRANDRGQSNTGGATHERRAKEGEKVVFLFLGGRRSEGGCSLLGGSRGGSATIAALGYRHRRENGAQLRHRAEHRAGTQLVEG